MKTKSLVVALLAGVLMLGPTARAAGPAYVTLSFGRAQWAPAEKCLPLAGAVDLGQVADTLAARGLVGNAVVITSYTDETTRKCKGGISRQASWADLEGLADRGWSVADGGTHNVAVDSMTYDEAYAEICGSIPTFTSHGLDPTGMWAWAGGNKHYSATFQRQIVATCFGWGRLYGPKANTTAIVAPPYTQKTWSLTGGWCAQGSGLCFTTARQNGANHGYQVPSRFLTLLSAKPDTWAVLQGYRFVTGAHASGAQTWDCTSSDPNQHWTNRDELYCWVDYLKILDEIPSGAVNASPAAVADAWGRVIG
jgi:hypothetical protein